MSSRLVNVRLDEERLRKVQILRKHGFVLSDIIRDAIDEQFDQRRLSRKPEAVQDIVRQVFEQHPDPAGLPPRTYNVHDRTAARAAILKKLMRKAQ